MDNGEPRVTEAPSAQDEMSLERRRELIDQLKEHISRVHDGDEDAIADMEKSLELIPSIARKWGNLNVWDRARIPREDHGGKPGKRKVRHAHLRTNARGVVRS